MNITSRCFALFVDIYENLYCSLLNNHRVDKKWSNSIISIELTKWNNCCRKWINKTNNQTYLSNRDCSLEGDQYLFIVDANNDRIIGSDENGFRCIFGFDSYGNIYVTDQSNNRVQKISLSKKSDRKYENCSIFSKSTAKIAFFTFD